MAARQASGSRAGIRVTAVTPDAAPAAADRRPPGAPGRRIAVLAVGATLFLSALSQTIVSPALPRIIGELGGMRFYSWVLTASLFASTISLALTGKLTDRYGRKPFLILGIALFLGASALTGAAQNMGQLIGFRAAQGFAGGIVAASSFAAIGDLFPPAERGASLGLFTGIYAVASIAGPLIGGFVTDRLGWRWLFYANLPLGVTVLVILWKGFPRARRPAASAPLDIAGMIALVGAILPVLLALTLVSDLFAWASYQTALLLIASTLAALALLRIERRAADPAVPLVAFRDRTFVVVSIVSFLSGVGLFGSIAYLPLFIQGVLGSNATNSGLVETPLMLSLTASSMIAGGIVTRSLRYRSLVLVGGAIVSTGVGFLATLDASSSVALPLAGMAIIGFGLGITMPLMSLAVQNALPDSLLGVASASTQFFRQMGGVLGMAVGGTLITGRLQHDLAAALPPELATRTDPATLRQLETPNILLSPSAMTRMRDAFALLGADGPRLYDETIAAMRGVLAAGLHEVFIGGLIVALIAMVASALLPNATLRKGTDEAQRSAAPVPARHVASLAGAPGRRSSPLRSDASIDELTAPVEAELTGA